MGNEDPIGVGHEKDCGTQVSQNPALFFPGPENVSGAECQGNGLFGEGIKQVNKCCLPFRRKSHTCYKTKTVCFRYCFQ